MRDSTTAALTLGALATLAIVVCFASIQLATLDSKISRALQIPTSPITMQTLTQDVVRTNGDHVTVTTTRGADETLDAFIGRHDATVAKLKTTP